MDGVGMRGIELTGSRHIGRHDVDVLAAQALVDLGRPHGCAALCGQEKFAQYQQFHAPPFSIDNI